MRDTPSTSTVVVLAPYRSGVPPARRQAHRRERRHKREVMALFIGVTILQLWNITLNGMSNDYYASAIMSSTYSWEAWFFGSYDPENYITVDKPAGGLWLMGLSARIFGFSSASMLIPQALLAVASAALLYGAIRRVTSHYAGLLAVVVFALTPIVTIMFRDNNPDASMIFGMMIGAYGVTRALTTQRHTAALIWMTLSGVGIGIAFLAKTLQGCMALPVFVVVYLMAQHFSLRRRCLHLAVAALAWVVSCGWWFVLVALTPASRRPYVGGTRGNSELELAIGGNGFDRIVGGGHSEVGRFPGFAGPPSLWRLSEDAQALHAAWLIPTALVGIVASSIALRQVSWRKEPAAWGLVLWGGWLVSNYLVLTYMKAAFHPYYVILLALPIAGVIGVSAHLIGHHPHTVFRRGACACLLVVSSVSAWVLLGRHAQWLPVLRWVLLGAGLIGGVLWIFSASFARHKVWATLATVAVSVGGSAAVAIENVRVPKIPGAMPLPGPNWADGALRYFGQLPDFSAPILPELSVLLHQAGTRWAAAVGSSMEADPFIIHERVAVMALGGFDGQDSPMALTDFVTLVHTGQVRYYIQRNRDDLPLPGLHARNPHSLTQQVEAWVKARYEFRRIGKYDIYDFAVHSE